MLGGMTKKQSAPMVSSLTLNQTHGQIHKLLDRITELEDRFNQHSENFQPPSSDGPGSAPSRPSWAMANILKQAKSTVIIDEYLLQ